MVTREPPLDPNLLARLQSLGRMQSRYLWFIVVACLFYWQLKLAPLEDLRVPLIDLQLDSEAVLDAGPLILAFFVLVQMGTARAHDAVIRRLGVPDDARREELDAEPNFLDMTLYWPRSARGNPTKVQTAARLFHRFKYPAFLSLVLAEAAWLLCGLWPPASTRSVVLGAVGLIAWLLAAAQVVEQWWTRADNAIRYGVF